MLSPEIQTALKGYTANMTNGVTLLVQTGEHPKRAELLTFLSDFASVSENIQVAERDTTTELASESLASTLRSPVSFRLEVDDKPTGISFSGIPGGHEFNSLVLAVLQSSGTALKLEQSVQDIVSSIEEPLRFEVYIGLSCHNCPEVVQALNQFAILNPNISSEMIDGGLYPQLIEENNIQGVPSVFLNGKEFANGKVDTAHILEKLMARQATQNRSAYSAESKEAIKLPLQDVTIIGGGPAGVSAAIYSARKGLKVTMIADRIGGQVKDTMAIENLISIPKTTGPELCNAMQAHMDDYNITYREHFKVSKINTNDEDGVKTLFLSSGEQIQSKIIIVATGAQWRELGVPGEKENIGNGVAYCPHCDGPFFKGKDVAVVGGGNSGIEAALDLAGMVKSVTVFEFMPDLKADQVLIEQAQNRDNISIHTNVAVQEITAKKGKVNAIKYQNRETETIHSQELSGVFVQIGLIPNSGFLKGVVEMTQYGEVIIDEKGATSEPGIYACGDVTTVPYKQIIIAMGDGAKTALAAYDELLLAN